MNRIYNKVVLMNIKVSLLKNEKHFDYHLPLPLNDVWS